MNREKDEIDLKDIAKYISYRVELALYKILLEYNSDMTWEEFMLFFCGSEMLRKAAQCVAYESIELFDAKQFEFNRPENMTCDVREERGRTIQVASFFGEVDEQALALRLFCKAAIEYHRRMEEMGIACSKEELSERLLYDQVIIDAVSYGFQTCIKKIDFEGCWRKVGFEVLNLSIPLQ